MIRLLFVFFLSRGGKKRQSPGHARGLEWEICGRAYSIVVSEHTGTRHCEVCADGKQIKCDDISISMDDRPVVVVDIVSSGALPLFRISAKEKEAKTKSSAVPGRIGPPMLRFRMSGQTMASRYFLRRRTKFFRV